MASSSKKHVNNRLRSQQFEKKITKRGKAVAGEKSERSPYGPIVIGFFLFVVVGSALFQIIRTAQTAGTH